MCISREIISSGDGVNNIKITDTLLKKAKCCCISFAFTFVLGGILLAVGIALLQTNWMKVKVDRRYYYGCGLSLTIIASFILLAAFISFYCCCSARATEVLLSVETEKMTRTIQHPFSKCFASTKIEFDLNKIHSVEASCPFTTDNGKVDLMINFYKFPPLKMGVSFKMSDIEALQRVFQNYRRAQSSAPQQEGKQPPPPEGYWEPLPYQGYAQTLPYQAPPRTLPYPGVGQRQGQAYSYGGLGQGQGQAPAQTETQAATCDNSAQVVPSFHAPPQQTAAAVVAPNGSIVGGSGGYYGYY